LFEALLDLFFGAGITSPRQPHTSRQRNISGLLPLSCRLSGVSWAKAAPKQRIRLPN
jgi:hypothetical protein